VLDEQFGDLLVRRIGTRKIETKSLGGQPTAVDKLNVGVEVGAVFGSQARSLKLRASADRAPPNGGGASRGVLPLQATTTSAGTERDARAA
jgi:hypothetical protein